MQVDRGTGLGQAVLSPVFPLVPAAGPRYKGTQADVTRTWVFHLNPSTWTMILTGWMERVRGKGERKFWPVRYWSAGYPFHTFGIVWGRFGLVASRNGVWVEVPEDVVQEARTCVGAMIQVHLPDRTEELVGVRMIQVGPDQGTDTDKGEP